LKPLLANEAVEESFGRSNMSIAMTAAEPSPQGQASNRSSETFERLAKPFRREIKLHCYRMLGSMHEAEDLAQDS
jgi:RNA polymerase sigma-70 factor (ECF subfamily)